MTIYTPRVDPPKTAALPAHTNHRSAFVARCDQKLLDIVHQGDPRYPTVLAFAQQIYRDELVAEVPYGPPVFMVVFSDQTCQDVVGCVGLNTSVQSTVFTSSLQFQRYSAGHPHKHIADQLFLAVNGCLPTTRILIATIAAYACHTGIHKVAYAGSPVFCKLIRRLGFAVTRLGKVNLQTVPSATREMMRGWNERYKNAESCLMDTSKGLLLYPELTTRHKHTLLSSYVTSTLLNPVAQYA